MPILDLLASISGEKPPPPSNPAPRPSAPLPKRKAEDELRTVGVKVARAQPAADTSLRPNGQSSKPSHPPGDKPTVSSNTKAAPAPRPAVSRPVPTEKSNLAGSKPRTTGSSSTNGDKSLPSRPAVNRPAPGESAPPRKRSYKEIMALAKANAEQRESLGKIIHKSIDRGMTMKERKELKAGDARKAKTATPGQNGSTTTPSRHASRALGTRSKFPSGQIPAKKTESVVEEKKVKKAALATTGYTGTARPPPGASAPAKGGAVRRSGLEPQSRERSRYGAPSRGSRNRYDEEDDDLDDFIEYDDEEDEPGYGNRYGYGYGSQEDESDMEAGLSDIETEEQQAARLARREDQEQEELEKRLKREKEERKRRLLQSAKSKAGAR